MPVMYVKVRLISICWTVPFIIRRKNSVHVIHNRALIILFDDVCVALNMAKKEITINI